MNARRLARSSLPVLDVLILLFLLLSFLFPLPSRKPSSLVIRDRNGEFLHAFPASDGIWRLRTKPGDIPEKLKRVLIHKEDRFFFLHPGVNPISLLRAFAQNAIAGGRVSGASTITMQVARLLEPKQRTYWGKMVEMFRAVQLELCYTKDQILEMYLSMVPLGGNVEGLESAALLYYQKPLDRLNIANLIDLILIPNDPNRLRPDRDPSLLRAERLRWGELWRAEGLLSPEDSLIVWQTSAGAQRKQPERLAPHYALRLRAAAGRKNEIIGTIDMRIQRIVEKLMQNHVRPWQQKGVSNAAALVIANKTRQVMAYVGSVDFEDSAARGQVDAIRAVRSPGSTLKPFLCALQMERGLLTPKSVLLDTPFDAEGFAAENYDGTYSGLVYAEVALRRSLNVPIIRLLQQGGVPSFMEHLQQLGFASLEKQKERLGLSMIVGGCGITLEELTTAYASFPNGGVYARPVFAQEETGETPLTEVYSRGTAFMITEILAGLDRPDLPNNFESSINLPRVAYKTGTSYGRRDAWAIGYSAEYTVGIWVGNATNAGNPELVGSKAAAPLLFDVFNSISTSHQKTILPEPEDIRVREVCARSGHVPTPRCTRTVSEYYSATRTIPQPCEVDREYLVSPNGKHYYCPTCLGNHAYKLVAFTEYPPELLSFWESIGRSIPKAPPHFTQCSRVFNGEGPRILSPSHEMTYFLVSDRQKLPLYATSGLDVRQHVWYVDDRFLGRARAGAKLFLSLGNGEHTITCSDEKGRTTAVKITIKKL